MQGWRIGMEDAKIAETSLTSDSLLFGVFDGHGGKEVAHFVERHFCQELLQNRNFQTNRFEVALQENFLRMDQLLLTKEGQRELVRIQRDLPDSYNVVVDDADSLAGCTSVVALIKGNKLYVANAGDSRCVLAKAGKAIEMSYDHKPDNQPEKDRITRAGGSVQDGRVMGNLNLSRAIGDLEYKKNTELAPEEQMVTAFPDIKVEEITQDCDFMILACDGIWDILTCQQCVDMCYQGINQNNDLGDIVERVIDRCLAPDVASTGGLGCDNMTMILVKFKH